MSVVCKWCGGSNEETAKPQSGRGRRPLSEKGVQCSLFWHLDRQKRHKWIAPNVTLFLSHQMDLCSILPKSGLLNEYEIKLTRADFKNDAKSKPEKFEAMEENLNGIFELTRTPRWGKPYLVSTRGPNFFHYVVPHDLIRLDEVPAYAGLIYFNPDNIYPGGFVVVRKAVRLHDLPATDATREKIAMALMYRCWTAKDQLLTRRTVV